MLPGQERSRGWTGQREELAASWKSFRAFLRVPRSSSCPCWGFPARFEPGFVSPAPREEVAYVTCTYRSTCIDQPDFLATVDLNPRSPHYGQVPAGSCWARCGEGSLRGLCCPRPPGAALGLFFPGKTACPVSPPLLPGPFWARGSFVSPQPGLAPVPCPGPVPFGATWGSFGGFALRGPLLPAAPLALRRSGIFPAGNPPLPCPIPALPVCLDRPQLRVRPPTPFPSRSTFKNPPWDQRLWEAKRGFGTFQTRCKLHPREELAEQSPSPAQRTNSSSAQPQLPEFRREC